MAVHYSHSEAQMITATLNTNVLHIITYDETVASPRFHLSAFSLDPSSSCRHSLWTVPVHVGRVPQLMYEYFCMSVCVCIVCAKPESE